MTSAPQTPAAGEIGMGRTLGLARLSRASASPETLQALWDELLPAATAEDGDPGALHDLGALLVAAGDPEKGLEVQATAIAQQRVYLRPTEGEPSLRLLALMRPGDFMANTPLDFLLEGSGVELVLAYIDGPPSPADLPPHDVAFFAIGEAAEVKPLLLRLEGAFDPWPAPVLNNQPALIAGLTRDEVHRKLSGCAQLLSPAVTVTGRADLGRVAAGAEPAAVFGEGFAYPFIVRPLGTHAGSGMEKIGPVGELGQYLSQSEAETFYMTSFVDYSGEDGLFRKYRIVLIEGRPFISHMAVSPRWMVHYLNADMEENAANRAEEALAMETFDDGFAARHAEAFEFLHQVFPLDYFGFDCAETKDGRLLIFEIDVALIVHAMDSEELYPYKIPAMKKLFAAFVAMLEMRAADAR